MTCLKLENKIQEIALFSRFFLWILFKDRTCCAPLYPIIDQKSRTLFLNITLKKNFFVDVRASWLIHWGNKRRKVLIYSLKNQQKNFNWFLSAWQQKIGHQVIKTNFLATVDTVTLHVKSTSGVFIYWQEKFFTSVTTLCMSTSIILKSKNGQACDQNLIWTAE
jgi:hypothetical protein